MWMYYQGLLPTVFDQLSWYRCTYMRDCGFLPLQMAPKVVCETVLFLVRDGFLNQVMGSALLQVRVNGFSCLWPSSGRIRIYACSCCSQWQCLSVVSTVHLSLTCTLCIRLQIYVFIYCCVIYMHMLFSGSRLRMLWCLRLATWPSSSDTSLTLLLWESSYALWWRASMMADSL